MAGISSRSAPTMTATRHKQIGDTRPSNVLGLAADSLFRIKRRGVVHSVTAKGTRTRSCTPHHGKRHCKGSDKNYQLADPTGFDHCHHSGPPG